MKIALVSPYDFAHPGGVVNHVLALYKQFSLRGHEVRIIAPASQAIPDCSNKFIQIGKPRPIPTSGSIARVTISLHLAPQIKAALSSEQFDIVHLHEPFMPMLCSAVLRFSDGPNIGTFHASGGNPGYNFGWPVTRWMLKRRSRKLTGKIAVSRAAMEFARKYVPGYYNIIPNGVDLMHFSPHVEPIDRFMDGKMNILFVGRLERRKGVGYLLKAYKRVKKERPASRLIIVGPGSTLRRRYERMVNRQGLQDVVFTDRVSYEELPRYYRSADIFCSPAVGRESFGMVLLEAMATGIPIVASDIEGYNSVVTQGREGILVPPKDVNRLSEALLTFMADRPLRDRAGAQGLATAQNYSWDDIAGRILSYYERILSEPPWQKKSYHLEEPSGAVQRD